MMAFPSMLESAATQAGIPVPPDLDADPNTFRESHPQFFVLCVTQLGRPIHHGEHFENAVNLAKIPIDSLKLMTASDLEAHGVNCGLG